MSFVLIVGAGVLVISLGIVSLLLLRGYLYYRRCGGSQALDREIRLLRSQPGYTALSQVGTAFLFMVIVNEDYSFFLHKGLNYAEIWRNAVQNLYRRRILKGASTITQQLCKNLIFDFEKTFRRKAAEVFASRYLERHYTKDEILELYVNRIEYGPDCFGIDAACRRYLSKPPSRITPEEALSLVVLLPSPRYYKPEPDNARFFFARYRLLDGWVLRNFFQPDLVKLLRSQPFESCLDPDRRAWYLGQMQEFLDEQRWKAARTRGDRDGIHPWISRFNFTKGDVSRIRYLVIHYTGALEDARSVCQYFAGGDRGASAHYFVGYQGDVWQSVEDADVAWHCGAAAYVHPDCRNENSIGIELCVRKRDTSSLEAEDRDWYFEDATVNMAAALTRRLMARYRIPPSHVLRHYDVTGKICPNPYVYNQTGHTWEEFQRLVGQGGSPVNCDE